MAFQTPQGKINHARDRGFSRAIHIQTPAADIAALVKPGADLDDSFVAFDIDNLEYLKIFGWNVSIDFDAGESCNV